MTIHPTAIVSPEAQLGQNVSVGAFASIEAGVVVGDDCVIRERAHLCSGAVLGRNCRVHMNAVIGHDPQDFAFQGGPIRTTVGDNVVVRENATIHGSAHGEGTVIGDNCFLMVGCHVAHDCKLGRGVILTNGALLAGHVQVEDNAFISGNACIHQHVRVGRLTMVAGTSCIGMDLPPYVIADGINAITALNVVGLRRSPNLTDEDRRQIKAAFKVLYRRGLSLGAALEQLERDFNSPAVKKWVAFFRAPNKRGYCRYFTGGRRGEQ